MRARTPPSFSVEGLALPLRLRLRPYLIYKELRVNDWSESETSFPNWLWCSAGFTRAGDPEVIPGARAAWVTFCESEPQSLR